NKNEDIARELLQHGADPNRGKDEGDPPLHIAVAYGWSIVEDLLKAKADPHLKNDRGNSAFLTACENGQDKIARTLLEQYRANINEQNPAGDNALSFVLRSQGSDKLLQL